MSETCPECGAAFVEESYCGEDSWETFDCNSTLHAGKLEQSDQCVINSLRSALAAATKRAETAHSPCIGSIIKVARIGVDKGMRQFAGEVGIVPSRLSEIEVGAEWTPEEIGFIAARLESARQDGYQWRDEIVAKLAAAEQENARLRESLANQQAWAEKYCVVPSRNAVEARKAAAALLSQPAEASDAK